MEFIQKMILNRAYVLNCVMRYFLLVLAGFSGIQNSSIAQNFEKQSLQFNQLPDRWDKGIPLGNGMIGVLVWQQGDFLRLSLDRADLWDLRPTAEIHKYSYQWAYEHRISNDWDTVWKVADEPYDRDPGPTKLPGAAVEFDIKSLGNVKSVKLDIATAICTVLWENGTQFRIFVHALEPLVRYEWIGHIIEPKLRAPEYGGNKIQTDGNQVVNGSDLKRLGYEQAIVVKRNNVQYFVQKAWGSLQYESAVKTSKNYGCISLTSHYNDRPKAAKATKIVQKAECSGFDEASTNHKLWWTEFWKQSSIQIPDKKLERQWYMEMYKFGSASRKGAPPISLQAIWTADNGKLPPWKGDFHSDLNTQLSYWPAYSSNHLKEAEVFTDWLWENKDTFQDYALKFFKCKGLNVPGVATLRGKPMGGWHMYAMSPTIGAWLSQHFYWQWRFSGDSTFLSSRAYPWVEQVALFLEQLTVVKDGVRTLPMGSSPEFNDGGMKAWFLEPTNYDLALCKSLYFYATEMARALEMHNEANHWEIVGSQFPNFDINSETGLTIAPGSPYNASHRHFSHLMAFHPMGILKYDLPSDREIIEKSIANLEQYGSSGWTGYSYAWLANIYARMHKGDKARDALTVFSNCFCSPNTFHLNGDQCKGGYSAMTYDPFTLEGNFAFASALQEMLLQSHSDVISIFPAIPVDWKDVAFNDLRAEGAFLVSAKKENGVIVGFSIKAPVGGKVKVKLPFITHVVKQNDGAQIDFIDSKTLLLQFTKGGRIEIENGYE